VIGLGLLAAVLVAFGDPSVKPRPIGVGPRYHPPAATARVLHGRPVAGMQCARSRTSRYGVHIEVFAHRKVVIVPAGIGVARPFATSFGAVVPRGCSYAARTLLPTGVVEIRTRSAVTLGDLFAIWGQPLGTHRLVGFRSERPVLTFVGGRRWLGDARAIPLKRHAQVVLEIGGYVSPHARFLFPKGL
jgi:hypothetical protein